MDKKEYRTIEQFEEIVESMTNGNWTQAGEECIEYGFWASDLLKALEAVDYIEECGQRWCELVKDFVTLAELAQKLRNN